MLQDIPSFINGGVRLLKHDQSIVKEDDLDMRWEELTGETVDEIIFLSKHTAVSNRPALTVHPIGKQSYSLDFSTNILLSYILLYRLI